MVTSLEHPPNPKTGLQQGYGQKMEESAPAQHDEDPDGLAVDPLDWTYKPAVQKVKDGHACCYTTVPQELSKDKRCHPVHLVREVEIEPDPRTPCHLNLKTSGRAAEILTVSESDFRKCGADLTTLRKCALAPLKKPISNRRPGWQVMPKSSSVPSLPRKHPSTPLQSSSRLGSQTTSRAPKCGSRNVPLRASVGATLSRQAESPLPSRKDFSSQNVGWNARPALRRESKSQQPTASSFVNSF